MKRLITAVSFAALAVPAIAAGPGAPYEKTEFDRTLPQVQIPERAPSQVNAANLPYEKAQFDRGLYRQGQDSMRFAAAAGSTVSDASIASDAPSVGATESVWANDPHFIAPPQ